jgi:hypothetical protein
LSEEQFKKKRTNSKKRLIQKLTQLSRLPPSHNDAIQALAFNPVTGVLASSSVNDFGTLHGLLHRKGDSPLANAAIPCHL